MFKHTCQPVPIDLFFKTVVIFLSYSTTVLLSMLQYLFHDHYAQNTKLIYKYTGNRRKFLLPVISFISNIMILSCMMIAHVINWCYMHFGMISNTSVIYFLTVLVSISFCITCTSYVMYCHYLLALWIEKRSHKTYQYMYKCIMDLRVTRLIIIFSSPMLKGSSELSDCFLSSTHLSISFCLPVNYLKTFLTTSPEPHGQFQANLAQNILREAD